MKQSPYPRRSGAILLLLGVSALAGCHSRLVEVTILNQGPALHVMEFDYPNASFGYNNLTTGASLHRRVKVQGAGAVSLQYEDAAGHNHTATGPLVNPGDEGTLLVKIDAAGALSWNAGLSHAR